ncbi:MAG TPA: ABC transporter permease [Candidatus Limnocylindrales bacterium]|nr:ABC transporter permease [Candidatus Limnocylindrales bacterium]
MRRLRSLSLANLKSFTRDRAALFWTLAFPILFVILFGTIFSGGGTPSYTIGWVDQDQTPASAQLESTFQSLPGIKLTLDAGTLQAEQDSMRQGHLDAVLVIPAGFGAAVGPIGGGPAASAAPSSPGARGATQLTLYIDPSHNSTAQALGQVFQGVIDHVNLAIAGGTSVVSIQTQQVQTQALTDVSYFVPSILAMALMQLGVFASIPLVQQREKLILKRLNATPLPRWTLVVSNIVVRLVIAAVQTALIVAIGVGVLGVQLTGNWAEIVGIVFLGAVTFVSIGYVIASFARTEEAANGLTSIVQFPLMFLSGIFFPLEIMPQWLRSVATVMPLTYLGDALRQVMVGGTPFVPLGVDVVVLAGWLVVCLAVSARFFRWQ